jgi:broad specificity phosphatase PhoE
VVRAATSILVLRHGESEWNVQQRWQGRADIPLTPAGERQARDAASRLGTFAVIASSHLQRAAGTASIIAEHHGTGPVLVDERLQEVHVGPWEGLTRDEIELGYPGFLAAWRKPDGFESDADVVDRATAALLALAARTSDAPALAISHSGVIRTMRDALGAPNPRLPNLGGSWFHVADNGSISAGDVVSVLDGPRPVDSL